MYGFFFPIGFRLIMYLKMYTNRIWEMEKQGNSPDSPARFHVRAPPGKAES